MTKYGGQQVNVGKRMRFCETDHFRHGAGYTSDIRSNDDASIKSTTLIAELISATMFAPVPD